MHETTTRGRCHIHLNVTGDMRNGLLMDVYGLLVVTAVDYRLLGCMVLHGFTIKHQWEQGVDKESN